MVCFAGIDLAALAFCPTRNPPLSFGQSLVRNAPPRMLDWAGVAGAAMIFKTSLDALCSVETTAATWLSADMIESDTARTHWHETQNYTWCLRAEFLDARWEGPASMANRLRCMNVLPLAGPVAMAMVPTAAVAGAVVAGTMTLSAFCNVATTAATWKSANMIQADTAMADWRTTKNYTYFKKAEALYARWNDPVATIILWRAGRVLVVPRASEMIRNNGPWWLKKRPDPTSSRNKLDDAQPDEDEAFSDGFDDFFAAYIRLPQPEAQPEEAVEE